MLTRYRQPYTSLAAPLYGHSDLVFTVAFSPDGTRVFSGSWDGTMIVWDVPQGDVDGRQQLQGMLYT